MVYLHGLTPMEARSAIKKGTEMVGIVILYPGRPTAFFIK